MVTTKSNCLNADSKMFCCVQWYLVKTAATQLLVKFILKHYFVKTGPKISIALEKSTDLPLIASPSALWHFIQNMPRKAQTKHLYLSYLRWTSTLALPSLPSSLYLYLCVFLYLSYLRWMSILGWPSLPSRMGWIKEDVGPLWYFWCFENYLDYFATF